MAHQEKPTLPSAVCLRLKDAARYLAISPRSLADRGWRRRQGIPASKVGRAVVFDTRDLDAYLNRHRERTLRPIQPIADPAPDAESGSGR